jgi:hypothetical protein
MAAYDFTKKKAAARKTITVVVHVSAPKRRKATKVAISKPRARR